MEFGSLWGCYSSLSDPVDLSVRRAFAGLALIIRRDLVSEKRWERDLVPETKNTGWDDSPILS